MKKPSGVKSSVDAQEMILKQRQVYFLFLYISTYVQSMSFFHFCFNLCSIDEIMGNELWQPNVGNPVSSSQFGKIKLILYDVL